MTVLPYFAKASLIALLLNLVACGGGSSAMPTAALDGPLQETPAPDTSPDSSQEDAVVRMILLGDSGSGSEGAYAVGKAVAKVCAARGCDLVLGLGDNIYESGVSSALDPQFEEKFELPFAPIDLPFYFVLGNHDNSGFFGGDGANNAKGDFEVDYHYRDSQHPDSPRQTSRWHMPSRYYRFTQGGEANAPLVELFGVDSNQIAGGFPDSNENYSYNNYGLVQAQWLKSAMASSKAKWKIVFAHHPYISNGSHGNAGNYDGAPAFIAPVLAGERYKAFVEETLCDKADFFFAGHDHDLQWLMPVASCGKTGFILSGAASKTRSLEHRDDNPVFYEKGDSYGFVWVEIKGDKMVGEIYQVDPADAALGLSSLSQPEPAFRREQIQQEAIGLPESEGFTSPLQTNDSFDVNGETGNLDPVQTQFSSGFNSLAEAIPEENISRLVAGVGESGTALLEVADSLITGLQGAATEQNPDLALAGAARASQALQYALQSLQGSLVPAEGQGLPAPLDQLSAVLAQFSAASPNADDDSANGNASANLRAITDPLRNLASNIQNIVDGIAEEGDSLPVAGASLDLLSELLIDVTRLLDATGNVGSGEMAQVLASTTDDLLANILLNVVPIEEFAPSEVSDAIGLGPKFLGSVLLLVSQEVAYHLDSLVLPPILQGLAMLPLSALDELFAAFTL
ncbi:hypothetical protein HNQ57_002357 [Zhongshania antarctica]|uniref:Calcineurin-like phosphoesterase domain-containing protein n=1 Tax=Zhongshania antarctica TaxID=641702 RepID=A0A840R6B1_9GAMM|nr:metallophosphoesterase [Zhongshania antarctica]MBB5188078.1 hypothetical protein [Zhongshania antarctica]